MHVRLPRGLQTLCLMMLNIKDEWGITEIWHDRDYLGMPWRNNLFPNEGLHSNPALETRPKSLCILSHLLTTVPKPHPFSKESNLGGHWASSGSSSSSLLLSAAQHFLYFCPRFQRWYLPLRNTCCMKSKYAIKKVALFYLNPLSKLKSIFYIYSTFSQPFTEAVSLDTLERIRLLVRYHLTA